MDVQQGDSMAEGNMEHIVGYILDADRQARPTKNIIEWSLSMQDIDKRRVDLTELPDKHALDDSMIVVSTVFLGMDYQFGGGPPLLFETLVQGGHMDGHIARYTIWDEAMQGHAHIVALVKGEENNEQIHKS